MRRPAPLSHSNAAARRPPTAACAKPLSEGHAREACAEDKLGSEALATEISQAHGEHGRCVPIAEAAESEEVHGDNRETDGGEDDRAGERRCRGGGGGGSNGSPAALACGGHGAGARCGLRRPGVKFAASERMAGNSGGPNPAVASLVSARGPCRSAGGSAAADSGGGETRSGRDGGKLRCGCGSCWHSFVTKILTKSKMAKKDVS
mmetsp:Transcript_63466/g.183934  ORF Transcript_63466/g.183934 Transcript_63466/m.183934 type:complete len:206 (-) Transcript_63466:36-653(-)